MIKSKFIVILKQKIKSINKTAFQGHYIGGNILNFA